MNFTESSSIDILEGVRITGLALNPQVSRNNIFYSPSILKQNNGKTVPMYLNHKTQESQIGNSGIIFL